MKTLSKSELATTVAATIGGEDVRNGDFVSILSVTVELPSYLWHASEALLPAHELVRLRMIPEEAGTPLKVFAACLPFIYAKTAAGEWKTLDLRKTQIVRFDRACAKKIWKALKPKPAHDPLSLL